MSDAVLLAIIAAVVPTLTVLLQWRQQNRKIEDVHEIVNSQRTEMVAAIEALKKEVARLQSGGADTPTTPLSGHMPPVSIDAGHVTVDKPKRDP